MKKISFILPYTGKFNNYFNLFLKSCSLNPTIDWYIFTDNILSSEYKNIHVVNMRFKEIQALIQKKYDFQIALQSPYEFCDFKVAYGEIFYEYIKEYDFWGFCDCDLIFGDIRKFITDEMLESYDKIYLRGHCTLFRNSNEINTLYKMPINGKLRYKEVFQQEGIHHFDEGLPDKVEGINMIFYQAGKRVYDKYDFMDLEVSRYDFIQADFVNDKNEQIIAENSYFVWENGCLKRMYLLNGTIKSEEYMYIHFQKRKMKLKINSDEDINEFIIVPNKFIPYKIINEKDIVKLNKKRIY